MHKQITRCFSTILEKQFKSHLASSQSIPAYDLVHTHGISSFTVPSLQHLTVQLTKKHPNTAYSLLTQLCREKKYRTDWYSPLVFIKVIEGCCNKTQWSHAIELYHKARQVNVPLDRGAYRTLIHTLIDMEETSTATEIVLTLCKEDGVEPDESIYLPVVSKLLETDDYLTAVSVLKSAKERVKYISPETYNALVDACQPYLKRNNVSHEDHDGAFVLLNYLQDLEEEISLEDDFELEFSDHED